MPLPIPPTNRSGRLQTTRPRSPAASMTRPSVAVGRRRCSTSSRGGSQISSSRSSEASCSRGFLAAGLRDDRRRADGRTLASTVAEGGIASGFIRQSEGIALSVLRSINGFQFVITLAFAAALTPIALQFGLAGAVTALMVWSMPIASPQIAGRVVLGAASVSSDRHRGGGRRTRLLRLGDRGCAGGLRSLEPCVRHRGASRHVNARGRRHRQLEIARAFACPLSRCSRSDRLRNSLLLVQSQNVLYGQGKNIVIAIFGGTAALGFWVLADRLLQLPQYLMYQPINRVAFPAFSQFIASGRDPRPVLERVVRLSFAASTLVLPAFLVAVPGVITSLFGAKWDDAALIFPGVVHLVHRGPGWCRLHSVPVRRRSTV